MTAPAVRTCGGAVVFKLVQVMLIAKACGTLVGNRMGKPVAKATRRPIELNRATTAKTAKTTICLMARRGGRKQQQVKKLRDSAQLGAKANCCFLLSSQMGFNGHSGTLPCPVFADGLQLGSFQLGTESRGQ
jgi:hypothetical protein